MKVIKRDGKLQNFDLGKIKTSITRASDDAKEPFNVSDIENIAKEIKEEVKALQKDIVSSEAIQSLVLSALEKAGFNLVAKYYTEGKVE